VNGALGRIAAIVENEVRLLRRDLVPVILVVAMPVAIIPFIVPGTKYVLQVAGYTAATGAEHAVPGLAVLFSSFTAVSIALTFYREHGWNTWNRLRISAGSSSEIILGKTVPSFLMTLCQMLLLFSLGVAAFDLSIRGSVLALGAMCAAHAMLVVGIAILLVSFCNSVQQANAIANVGGIVAAGVGGAITPESALPGWVRAVAPLSPPYWTMRGLGTVILDGGGLRDVVVPLAVLLAMTGGLVAIACSRFRMDEGKRSWS